MDKALDKKKLPAAPAAAKAKAPAPPGKAAEDRTRLGAILRPDPVVAGPAAAGLKVGGAADKAEAEADKVAEAVAAPENGAADTRAPAATGKDQKDDAEPAHYPLGARAPPVPALARTLHRRVPARFPSAGPDMLRPSAPGRPVPPGASTAVRAPCPPARDGPIRRLVADNGNQPNTDSLSAVPALAPNLAPVSVAAQEETNFDEMSPNDFGELSQGGSGVMLKSAAHPRQIDRLDPGLSARIRAPAPGQPLPAPFRTRMERRMGVSLTRLRVHTGAEPAALAAHLGARAFAHGCDIWLSSPADLSNTRLLAHEAAHCLQQGAGQPLTAHARPEPRAPPANTPLRRLAEGETDNGLLASGAEKLADKLDSYGLLKVLIGKRLFTGEPVPQDAMSYVGAFMKFVGADETFENMKKSGSLEKGFQTIRDSARTHDLTFARVTRIFDDAYDNFSWTSPIESFTAIFGPFFADVMAFAADILKVVAELVAEAFVLSFGPLGQQVWDKIKAIGEVIDLVLADPMNFALNLIKAIGLGIQGFGDRIFTHIKAGLLSWLLGPLVQMGVTLPEKLDLMGIINVILQVMGLTYPQLRPRLIAKLNPHGELKVTAVEKLVEILNILRTEGLAGVWRKFLEYVDNLQGMVIEAIRGWVIRAVVEAGIRKLVAWSNPAGALIDILLTIYKLIVFFVERLQQIIDFASSVFDSIGKIARGQLTEAAQAVERTLALTIPVILSFMCALLGLPDIAGTIRGLITRLREKVAAAVDKVLDFIIGKLKKLIARLIAKFKGKKGEPEGAVNMQGTPHKLLWKQEGKRRQLYLHSNEQKATGETFTKASKDIAANCAPPLTTVSAPALAEVGTTISAREKEEEKLAAKPESVAAAPDQNTARAAVVTTIAPQIEKGTDKANAATEAVKSGEADIDKQPPGAELKPGESPKPEQKENVEADMEDLAFRYVIVPEGHQIEASWGPWASMQGKREAFKTSMAGREKPLEGKFGIDLDHNPEYQILWRLGHTEYSKDQRETGQLGTPGNRMFPSVSNLYGNGPLSSDKRDRAGADTDRVMAIRYDLHRKLDDTQTSNVSSFLGLTEYNAKQKAFVPKGGKTEQLRDTKWPDLVKSAAETHRNQVVDSYRSFAKDNFVRAETVKAVESSSLNMLNDSVAILNKGVALFPDGENAKGYTSGIAMTPDPVNAEYLTGDYEGLAAAISAKANRHGAVFDKHHLIEKSITTWLQTTVNDQPLLPALKNPSQTAMGVAPGTPPLTDTITKGFDDLRKSTPKLAALDTAKRAQALYNTLRVDSISPMKPDNTEKKGFAIVVLKKMNAALSSQPISNAKDAITIHMGGPVKAAAAAAADTLKTGLAAIKIDPARTPAEAEDDVTQATAAIRAEFKSKVSAEVRTAAAAFPKVIETLTAKAHDEFEKQVKATRAQTHPENAGFKAGSDAARLWADLEARYTGGPGNLAFVQAENKNRWVA